MVIRQLVTLEKLISTYKLLFRHKKEIFFVYTLFGFLCLFFYTSSEGVPFPLSLLYLSYFLLVLGFPILLLVSFLPAFLLFFVIADFGVFEEIYPQKSISSKQNLSIYSKLTGWVLVFSLLLFSLFFMINIYSTSTNNYLCYYIMAGLALYIFIRPLFTGCYLQKNKGRKDQIVFIVSLFLNNVMAVAWSIILPVAIFLIFRPLLTDPTSNVILYFSFTTIISITHYIITSPYFNVEKYLKKAVIIGISLLIFFTPSPAIQYLTQKSLELIKKGGKFSTTMLLEKGKNLPDQIFENKSNGLTKTVLVVLDDGDFIHLMTEDDNSHIHSIKSAFVNSNSSKRQLNRGGRR